MRRFILLLIFVLCLCFSSGAEARYLALLIGVDDYTTVSKLECCVNDMQTLKEALMKIKFKEEDIQILVTGEDKDDSDLPTKTNIENRISALLSQANSTDIVFIAFSGHGAQEEDIAYFCPLDVKLDKLAATGVSINKIMDDLAKCNAKFKWMVVDACRYNPNQDAKNPNQDPSGLGSKGLRVVPTPPAGIALFQSCANGEESFEDIANGNGFFTKNFAAALSGEADDNNDGKLTLMEVYSWTTEKTKEQVQKYRKKSQTPYFSGTTSDFTLIEDPNFLKAKELAAEARDAMQARDYDRAVEKYDIALDLCPHNPHWKRDRDLADSLRKPKIDPMKVTVPDDFATIEEAYKNVKDGGTITIQSGKYEFSKTLVVNRKVTFRGSAARPESVLIVNSSSNVFKIADDSPSFQNLTVVSESENRAGFCVTGGTPKLFNCIVTSRRGSGIDVLGENANPQVDSCIIKNCGMCGVRVLENGLGKFTDCEIFGNALAGIQVSELGNPTLAGCKIHDGKASGALVLKNGLGKFIDCEIYGNAKSGIEVKESGNPTFTRCNIHDGKQGGVYIRENGRGSFTDCEIYGNALVGIEVKESGNPTFTGCNIHDGKQGGVYVHDNGMGTFNNNTLERNYTNGAPDNWDIQSTASSVRGSGNRPELPSRSGRYY